MSVLVKGMEMPKSCEECPFCIVNRHDRGDDSLCRLINKEVFTFMRSLPQDCPLVPVPPHGRLVVGDVLMQRFEKEEMAADEHGRDFSFSFKSGGENCAEWWSVQRMLMDAPTVIEAEGGDAQ